MFAPSFTHKTLAYLEEEAVSTYTLMLDQIDKGELPMWTNMPCTQEALDDYKLGEGAKIRDLILQIRADTIASRQLHHHMADNPNCKAPEQVLPTIEGY